MKEAIGYIIVGIGFWIAQMGIKIGGNKVREYLRKLFFN